MNQLAISEKYQRTKMDNTPKNYALSILPKDQPIVKLVQATAIKTSVGIRSSALAYLVGGFVRDTVRLQV